MSDYRAKEIARIQADPEAAYREIQGLRGSNARHRIEMGIIESLLSEPDYEPSSIDIEYWHATHDKVAQLVATRAEPKEPT